MSGDRSSTLADAEGNELGKVFIGGLCQATNEASLRAYFGQFGHIDDAVVMMDNETGRSRGFGFIKFKDANCVESVLQCHGHTIDNKAVDVKQSNIHAKGKVSQNLKIFVGGIAPEHDIRVMQSFFSQYGKVADVNLMLDQSKQRHRGFAFVTFDDEKVAQQLIQLHFVNINGRVVEIKAMRPSNVGQRDSSNGRLVDQHQAPIIYQQPQQAAAPMWHPTMAFDPGMPVAWTPAAWPSAGQQWCSSQLGVFDNAWPQTLVTAWPSGIMPPPGAAATTTTTAAAAPLLQPVAWDCSQQHIMQQQQQQQFLQQQLQQQLQQRSHFTDHAMPRIFQPQHHHQIQHQPTHQHQQFQQVQIHNQLQQQQQQQNQHQQQHQQQQQQQIMEDQSCSSRSSSSSSHNRNRQPLDSAWNLSANAFKESAEHQQIHHFIQAQHHNHHHQQQQQHHSHHHHQQQQQQQQPSNHVAAGDYDTQQQALSSAVTLQREP